MSEITTAFNTAQVSDDWPRLNDVLRTIFQSDFTSFRQQIVFITKRLLLAPTLGKASNFFAQFFVHLEDTSATSDYWLLIKDVLHVCSSCKTLTKPKAILLLARLAKASHSNQ